MNFYSQVGKMALGSRLRMLTDKITEDSARIYLSYGIDMQPKWFPVFYALSNGDTKTITSIAKEIGHSHPSVSRIISEMSAKGYVQENHEQADGRKTFVELTEKGKEITIRIKDQYLDVTSAIEEISAQSRNDLWKAIEEWEYLLEQRSLAGRVQDKRKQRESTRVEIIPFTDAYAADFRSLNEEWISTWFKMEEADYKALDDPQGYILNKGGYILIALYEGKAVGTCALIKMDDPEYDFELAKMAVSPTERGKNIGYLLGKAALDKARGLGARAIYLESNTILKPAIKLYEKLGFKKVVGHPTPYDRCNIQMGLILD